MGSMKSTRGLDENGVLLSNRYQDALDGSAIVHSRTPRIVPTMAPKRNVLIRTICWAIFGLSGLQALI
jgi:hypothetical protein